MNSQLIQYGILAAGMIASLLLFVSLKREVHKYMNRDRRDLEEIQKRFDQAHRPVSNQAREEPPNEPESQPQGLVLAPRSGFNLNRRVQAVRLLRRGEDVGHVAAALGVPRNEVELLSRVQEMAAASKSDEANLPPE